MSDLAVSIPGLLAFDLSEDALARAEARGVKRAASAAAAVADAEAVIAELTAQGLWRDPVVTEIAGPASFHAAEGHHQDYYQRNGAQPYCTYVVAPKVAKFRQKFLEKLKSRSQVSA